ncbi:unnamed protein product [Ectocarpus sp. 6 AP-2014]
MNRTRSYKSIVVREHGDTPSQQRTRGGSHLICFCPLSSYSRAVLLLPGRLSVVRLTTLPLLPPLPSQVFVTRPDAVSAPEGRATGRVFPLRGASHEPTGYASSQRSWAGVVPPLPLLWKPVGDRPHPRHVEQQSFSRVLAGLVVSGEQLGVGAIYCFFFVRGRVGAAHSPRAFRPCVTLTTSAPYLDACAGGGGGGSGLGLCERFVIVFPVVGWVGLSLGKHQMMAPHPSETCMHGQQSN